MARGKRGKLVKTGSYTPPGGAEVATHYKRSRQPAEHVIKQQRDAKARGDREPFVFASERMTAEDYRGRRKASANEARTSGRKSGRSQKRSSRSR